MADNTKESLSAWLDGEASEIEVHRLLRQVELDAGLKSNWVAYQQIRSVIRQEQRLSAHEHLQLNLRIKAAIEAEPPFADEFGKEQGSKAVKLYKPVAGLAVAASLVAAIFLGVQSTQLVDSGTTNGKGPIWPQFPNRRLPTRHLPTLLSRLELPAMMVNLLGMNPSSESWTRRRRSSFVPM